MAWEDATKPAAVGVSLNSDSPPPLATEPLDDAAVSSTVDGSTDMETQSARRLYSWNQAWDTGRTSFHNQQVNETLVKHSARFLGGGDSLRVFVPLCGKTVDIPWIAAQDGVGEAVGVEGVGKACQQFISENLALGMKESASMSPDGPPGGCFKWYQSDPKGVTIIQGDYFLLTKESAGLFDRVWDRGSFVAVSPGDRAAYVSVLRQLLRPGGAVLLSSLNRAAGTTEAMERGPPFSVTSAHLDDMFGDWCRIEKLDSVDLLATAGDWERFRDAGLTSLLEEIHLITRL